MADGISIILFQAIGEVGLLALLRQAMPDLCVQVAQVIQFPAHLGLRLQCLLLRIEDRCATDFAQQLVHPLGGVSTRKGIETKAETGGGFLAQQGLELPGIDLSVKRFDIHITQ